MPRRQQSSGTVELVDHTYDGRRVARRTHTSVDRNALAALLRSRMGLLWTLFLQLCSSWQDFVWYSVSCSLSAVEEQLVPRKCADARTTRSLVVIKVDRSTSSQYCASAFSAVSSRFFLTFFWENVNGCRVILLLLILYNTLVSVTELSVKDRKYDDLLPCPTWLAVKRATGIIINNSRKFEDLVFMIAQTDILC